MRRISTFILATLVALLCLTSIARAADFQWTVDCQERDEAGQLHYWLGYSSDADLPDATLGYIGNGPGIYMDGILAGVHDRAIDVLLPTDDDSVNVFAYNADFYADITITSATEAPDCSETPVVRIDYDDQGVVNNADNPRGNTCYGAGQVCITEEDWIAGWYRMHT